MRSMVRLSPSREMRTMRDEIDRLFDFAIRGNAEHYGAWTPAVDVHEDESGITFSAEVAGMNRDDIKVDVENNVLSISGERRFESEDQSRNYHLVERGYGSFRRSFSLPSTVDAGSADANYRDGLLSVRFSKRPEVKGRAIEIK